MKRAKQILKVFMVLFLTTMIVIQFFRTDKNISGIETAGLSKQFPINDTIVEILKSSCNDCHSNHTDYPWYFSIQPFAWWINRHIEEGKEELNFSEFSSYSARRQYRKFTEIKEQIEENEMPLKSYTLIHSKAILSESDKQNLVAWSEEMKMQMEQQYPIDSLKKKK